MKIIHTYSRCNGLEYLLVHKKRLWNEVQRVIRSVDGHALKTAVSKQRMRSGKVLRSPKAMNKAFSELLIAQGWSESRVGCLVTDSERLIRRNLPKSAHEQKAEILPAGEKSIFKSNQTGFVKERVAVELRFGKYLFVGCDLFLTHLASYVRDRIDVGIEILAAKSLQSCVSSGSGYYQGEPFDIIRNGRGIPAVPLVLIGVEP
jgi:hypothetical protein